MKPIFNEWWYWVTLWFLFNGWVAACLSDRANRKGRK